MIYFYRHGRNPGKPLPYDFVATFHDGVVTWYYSDGRMKVLEWPTDLPSVEKKITNWVIEGKWEMLVVPDHVHVAVRLSNPEDVYGIVTRAVGASQ